MVVRVFYLERFEFVVFEESGKKSVTLGYASDIFNDFLGNVR